MDVVKNLKLLSQGYIWIWKFMLAFEKFCSLNLTWDCKYWPFNLAVEANKGPTHKENSVWEPCVKCFEIHTLKFENKTKKHQMLSFQSFKWIYQLKNEHFCFIYFMWFARFQILMCALQSNWCTVLRLRLIYKQ